MKPAMIQARLKMFGTSQRDIARKIGDVSDSAINLVIHGRGRSRRIEQAIATAILKPLHQVFPQWYEPPSTPSALKKGNSTPNASLEDAIASLERAVAQLGKCLSDHANESMPQPQAWARLVRIEGIEFQLRNQTITQRGRLMRRSCELGDGSHG